MTYTGNKGKLCILHQSPMNVVLIGSTPLFCVANGHKLDYQYQWSKDGATEVGTNSPVLWVNKAGVYKCTVRSGLKIALSNIIDVVQGKCSLCL